MEPLKNGCDFFLHLEKHAASAFVFPSRGRTIQFVEFLLWSIRLSSRCVAMLTPVNRAHCHLSGSSGSMERESLWGNILQSKHVYPVQHSHFIVKSKYSTPGVCKLYQNSWIKFLAYQPFKPMNVHLFKMFSSPKLWTSAKQESMHSMHRLSTKQQPCTELSTLCKWNQRKPKHNTSPRPATRHRGEIGGASKRLH